MITEAEIKKTIAAAPKTGKVAELKDGGERGAGRLVLVIRPFENSDGTETRVTSEWYAYSYRGGRRASAKIGAYPTMSLAAARKEFREKFLPDISSGKALVGIRSRATKVQREATLRAMFDHYLEHLKDRPSEDNATRHLNHAAKALGESKLAASVKTTDISEYLGEVHGRGAITSADTARAYLSAAFNHAIKGENDYTKRGPVRSWGLTHNPVTAIPADLTARRVRNRFLTPAEWSVFFKWLETQDEDWVVAPAVRLMMLVGQREIEIIHLREPQYDKTEKMLDWEKTKNKRPHSIPLPRRAVTLMGSLVPTKDGIYFPGRTGKKPISYNSAARLVVKFLDEHPDTPKFMIANLRSTWKTLSGAAGLTKEMRDRLQNHARGDVASRHYDRWEQLPEKRAAMEQWSDYVDLMLSGKLNEIGARNQPVSLAEARAKAVA